MLKSIGMPASISPAGRPGWWQAPSTTRNRWSVHVFWTSAVVCVCRTRRRQGRRSSARAGARGGAWRAVRGGAGCRARRRGTRCRRSCGPRTRRAPPRPKPHCSYCTPTYSTSTAPTLPPPEAPRFIVGACLTEIDDSLYPSEPRSTRAHAQFHSLDAVGRPHVRLGVSRSSLPRVVRACAGWRGRSCYPEENICRMYAIVARREVRRDARLSL